MSQPHKCPVCGGSGEYHNGFASYPDGMTGNMSMVQCHACNGRGIVWEETPEQEKHRRVVERRQWADNQNKATSERLASEAAERARIDR